MRLPIALVTLCIASAPVQGQKGLTGSWQGYWSRAGDSMLVTLNVQRDTSTGRYAATFDSDRLRASGIPEVRHGCRDVILRLGDRTTAVFTGRLEGVPQRARCGRHG
jgi:hypothetical protein